jgi:hypothetical protein
VLDLSLQTSIFLLAQLKLEINNLLLFPQVRNNGTQFREFGVRIVGRLAFPRWRGRGFGSLSNASCLRTDRLEVLMEEGVLGGEILAAWVQADQNYLAYTMNIETNRLFKSDTSLSRASFCRAQLLSEVVSLAMAVSAAV